MSRSCPCLSRTAHCRVSAPPPRPRGTPSSRCRSRQPVYRALRNLRGTRTHQCCLLCAPQRRRRPTVRHMHRLGMSNAPALLRCGRRVVQSLRTQLWTHPAGEGERLDARHARWDAKIAVAGDARIRGLECAFVGGEALANELTISPASICYRLIVETRVLSLAYMLPYICISSPLGNSNA